MPRTTRTATCWALLTLAGCCTNQTKQTPPPPTAPAPPVATTPAPGAEAEGAHLTFHGTPLFAANCQLPLANPGDTEAFDEECGNEGEPEDSDKEARAAEYTAKNNLCADASAPMDLTFPDFKKLQTDLAHIDVATGNSGRSVSDRSVLSDLPLARGRQAGEGKVVRVVGLATVKASKSNEGVNCHSTAEGKTDIHINVSPDGVECDGVVVEIIPHRRPEHWTHDEAANLLDQSIVRVTGQLFLDSRHSVTPRTAPYKCPTPERISLWEVHPVYTMDICRRGSLEECTANDDSVWKAF